MTTPIIKIKVTPKNVVKGKMDVRFPARVLAESPILLDNVGGVYTFSMDINELRGSLPPIIGTGNEINVANGDGVAGNPTISLPNALTFTGKTVEQGTYHNPTITGTATIVPTTGTAQAGFDISQHGQGSTTGTNVFGYAYNHISIPSQKIDTSGEAVGIANGLLIDVYPQNGSKSNLIASTMAVLIPAGVTIDTSNPALVDFVGSQSYAKSSSSLGGTNTTSGAQGGIFGGNDVAINDTTNILGVIGREINVQTLTGATQSRRTALSLTAAFCTSQGAQFDTALNISSVAGNTVGWANGVMFSNFNGVQPMSTTGKLISTQGSATVAYGVDFSSYTISTAAFLSTGFAVDGSGNVNAASYLLSSIPVVSLSSPYVIHFDASSTSALLLGGTGDPSNYYRNTHHTFQARGGSTNFATLDANALTLSVPLYLKTYTVASLPVGLVGATAYATNCRVTNGTTFEGVGAGTGGIVSHNGTAWKVAGTNVTAVA